MRDDDRQKFGLKSKKKYLLGRVCCWQFFFFSKRIHTRTHTRMCVVI